MFGIIKRLFAPQTTEVSAEAEAELYKDFRIIPAPVARNGQWQLNGRIERTAADGSVQTHTFIRADTFPGKQDAIDHMLRKARLMIDQQGETLFG